MKKFLLILLLAGVSQAGWRWSRSLVFTDPDADACHAVGSAYLASSMQAVGLKWWQADLAALSAGLTWEIKDGLVPWERYGWIGGEGFSAGDVVCNLTGIVTNRLFHILLNKVKGNEKISHCSSTSSSHRSLTEADCKEPRNRSSASD